MEIKEIYDALYAYRKYPLEEKEYLYPIFLTTLSLLESRLNGVQKPLNKENNILLIIDYLIHEHFALLAMIKEEYEEEMRNSSSYKNRLSLIVCDKIFFNEYVNYEPVSLISKYDTLISTPRFILNFILNQLSNLSKRKEFVYQILFDAIQKGFLLSNTIFDLLVHGSETEAFSTWRTMHEMECVIKVLYEHPYLGDTYFLHIRYNEAFRNELEDKNEQERLILELKEKLKKHNLKVKDLKKYIEYGWMYEIKDQEIIYPDFKLNFRKGLEYVAGFSSYSSLYEMSSEIAHSSPLLIYSKKDFFRDVSILSVYGTFLRLEEIFFNLLKMQQDSDIISYQSMREQHIKSMHIMYAQLQEEYKEKYNIGETETE